jgi:hypothetical protein
MCLGSENRQTNMEYNRFIVHPDSATWNSAKIILITDFIRKLVAERHLWLSKYTDSFRRSVPCTLLLLYKALPEA